MEDDNRDEKCDKKDDDNEEINKIEDGCGEVNKPEKVTTVKEILNEILDCTITQKSRVENSTVKDLIGEILDCKINKKSSGNELILPKVHNQPGTSSRNVQSELQIYNLFKMDSKVEVRRMNSTSLKSLNKMLPSYSAVLKLPTPKTEMIDVSESFIPPSPPPRYAEVEGIWEDATSLLSLESITLGPDPMYVICPRCRIVVATHVDIEISNITHMLAFLMCVTLFWPCCMIPYCVDTFNNAYHSCPYCNYLFGIYKPCR